MTAKSMVALNFYMMYIVFSALWRTQYESVGVDYVAGKI